VPRSRHSRGGEGWQTGRRRPGHARQGVREGVTGAYEIERPDEVALLVEACRILSLCDELREVVERDGYYGW
jgi:hypothetical protein